ncbi:hypothetical protein [Caulobacter sp. UC70_42]|uniref:hypothetical protein n=1 Tax=Caulobacter sp. UC70_42 TaxID=3374551 RepID=UPI003756E91D
MTAMEMSRRPAASVGRRFYLIMSLLMAAVFVGGFSTTVPGDFAPPGLPLLLHVHGAISTCWVLLFVAQPAFIARGSLKLHRQVGMVGAGLAGLMAIMALVATVFAIRYGRVPPSSRPPSSCS